MVDVRWNIGLLMHIPLRFMEDRVFAAVAAAGFDDITLAQTRLFTQVGPQGTRLTELAERAQLSKQAAGYLVDRLEQAGYVERARDPTDARARLVRVAERGARSIPIAAAAIAEIETEWIEVLGVDGMAQLRSLLARLCQVTDPFASER